MKARVHIATGGQRLLAGLSLLAALLICFALNGAKASAAGCVNEAIREAQVSETLPQGTIHLPNCMALELVSPAKKYNQYAESPQLSANGDRVKFASLAALAETPKLGSIVDPYVATRTPSGWVTEATNAPVDIVTGSGITAIACAYAPDLSSWALFGSTATQTPIGITTAFRGALGSVFEPIGPTMVPLSGDFASGTIANSLCEGASADATHLFLAIRGQASYITGDPIPPFSLSVNIYEAYLDEGVPSLALLQRDKDGVVHGGRCGAVIGGIVGNDERKRGAVSADASRVYFTTNPSQPEGEPCNAGANKTRIMLSQKTPAGPVITGLYQEECTRVAPPCSSLDGNESYLGASQEGGRVFFTTSRQLANTDKDETTDLYLHDSSLPEGQRLTQITAGDDTATTPGEGAEFLGLSDYSGDGTRAYFVAKDVLTTAPNQASEVAQAGQSNLYLYQRDATYPTGRTVFIATLSATDAQTWSPAIGEGSRAADAMAVPRLGPDPEDISVGGNGRFLVFRTVRALGDGDTDSSADLYRYDSEDGALERISAADPGGQDNGPLGGATLPGPVGGFLRDTGPMMASFNRWASEDGETVVFFTAEKLDPLDTDTETNPYIWHQGAVTALPPATQPVLSMLGEHVAFVSDDRLLPEDGDGAKDVYVVRANGGYPIVIPTPPCAGEACQGAPGPRPPAQGIASQSTRTGNVKQAPCKKGQARKRGRCVKKQKRQRKQQGKANRKQGGRK